MQYEPYVSLDNLLFIFCHRLWTDSKNDNSPRSDNAQVRIGRDGRQWHQTAQTKEMGSTIIVSITSANCVICHRSTLPSHLSLPSVHAYLSNVKRATLGLGRSLEVTPSLRIGQFPFGKCLMSMQDTTYPGFRERVETRDETWQGFQNTVNINTKINLIYLY